MSDIHNNFKHIDVQPWYAIRTFNCQEQKVYRYLADRGLVSFIPLAYSKKVVDDENQGKSTKVKMIPAVHNLLFVQKKGDMQDMVKVLSECSVPISVFRQPGDNRFCEITDREMMEFRMLCDPQYETAVYMTQGEAEMMTGKNVRVITGPFKGSVGRLVRKHKQYYFLKMVTGMGVMIRISRWYCEPI